MFAGDANPTTGAQISVPEPIRLMLNITEDNLRPDDVEELKRRCARITRRADGQTEIGRVVRGITLLWRRRRYEEALVEAQGAVKAYPKSGELSCLLGRTHLMQTSPDFTGADDAFKEAQHKRCERPELTEYWALAKLKRGDIAGLVRITQGVMANGAPVSGVALLYRFAGLYRIARQREDRGDYAKAVEAYQALMREIAPALRSGRTDPVTADVVRLGSEVSNYMIEAALRAFEGERESAARVFNLAVEASDDDFPPVRHLRRVIDEMVASASRRGASSRRDGGSRCQS